jgi:phosphocarrier protein HPr
VAVPLRSQDEMSGSIVQQTLVVESPQGLHLRPLTAFAQEAAKYQSEVKVTRDGRSVDGKSAWDMITMISMPGAVLTIEADGPDAPAAVEGLIALLNQWSKIDSDNTDDSAL